jgi:hypothetical protein
LPEWQIPAIGSRLVARDEMALSLRLTLTPSHESKSTGEFGAFELMGFDCVGISLTTLPIAWLVSVENVASTPDRMVGIDSTVPPATADTVYCASRKT